MSLSGSQKTRIGGYLSGSGRRYRIPFAITVLPSVVTGVATVRNAEILSGVYILPSLVTATALVRNGVISAGSVTILPAIVAVTALVRSITIDDGTALPEYFYSNDTMVKYFREQTGVDSYNFNELAIAYYKQVAASNEGQFDDLNTAAKLAAGFVGLAPTDWRNF